MFSRRDSRSCIVSLKWLRNSSNSSSESLRSPKKVRDSARLRRRLRIQAATDSSLARNECSADAKTHVLLCVYVHDINSAPLFTASDYRIAYFELTTKQKVTPLKRGDNRLSASWKLAGLSRLLNCISSACCLLAAAV